jgi:hypothetical protein
LAAELRAVRDELGKRAGKAGSLKPTGSAYRENAKEMSGLDGWLTSLVAEAAREGASIEEIRAVLAWTSPGAPANLRKRLAVKA